MPHSPNRKPIRPNFLLNGPADCPDFYTQILWMRLEGLTIEQIARAMKRRPDTIAELFDLWQQQVALLEPEGWTPRAVNYRRVGRRKVVPDTVHRAILKKKSLKT